MKQWREIFYLCVSKLAILFNYHKLTVEHNILNCSCSVSRNIQQWLMLWERKTVTERRGKLRLSSLSNPSLLFEVALSMKYPSKRELRGVLIQKLHYGMGCHSWLLHITNSEKKLIFIYTHREISRRRRRGSRWNMVGTNGAQVFNYVKGKGNVFNWVFDQPKNWEFFPFIPQVQLRASFASLCQFHFQ